MKENIEPNILGKMAAVLENEYRLTRAQAAEELHNAIAVVIEVKKPEAETLLYVLDMIRFSVLATQARKVHTPEEKSEPKKKKKG